MFERKSLSVKPIELYDEMGKICYKDLMVGDLVVAVINGFAMPYIYCTVGGNEAYMHIDEYDYHTSLQKKRKEVFAMIGQKTLARVSNKDQSKIVLERNSVIRDTTEYLFKHQGDVLDAVIMSVTEHEIFVDIGNGIKSRLARGETSNFYLTNLKSYFKLGDIIKIVVTNYDTEHCRFNVSRRLAYRLLSAEKLQLGSRIVVTCLQYVNEKKDGIFVEFDPANIGIMDIPPESSDQFYPGLSVKAFIKAHKGPYFKSDFDKFI